MKILNVKDIEDFYFSEAMKIYLDSFSAKERQSIELIQKQIKENRNKLFIGIIRNDLVVFSLIYKFKNPKFYLLDYYGVNQNYRNQKIGTFFLKALFKEMKLDENEIFLIFEVEDPLYGINRNEKIRRVQFYRSLGVRQIGGMKYILPPLDAGKESTDMIIMIYPIPKHRSITQETLLSLVKELYIEKYNRNPNDPLLTKCLGFIPKNIRFI